MKLKARRETHKSVSVFSSCLVIITCWGLLRWALRFRFCRWPTLYRRHKSSGVGRVCGIGRGRRRNTCCCFCSVFHLLSLSENFRPSFFYEMFFSLCLSPLPCVLLASKYPATQSPVPAQQEGGGGGIGNYSNVLASSCGGKMRINPYLVYYNAIDHRCRGNETISPNVED